MRTCAGSLGAAAWQDRHGSVAIQSRWTRDRSHSCLGSSTSRRHRKCAPFEPAAKQKLTPDPYHEGEHLVYQKDGQWIERAPYFEAVAVTGEGVFDTLKAVSKLVIKALG